MPRRFGEDLYLAIKAKWRQLVRESGGTEHAAELVRTKKPRISEFGAPQHLDKFPGIDKIIDLELDSGLTTFTRYLADLHGMDLVQREARGVKGVYHHFSHLARETGEAVASIADMMADGKETPEERAKVVKELDDLIAVAQAARAEFNARPAIKAVK